MWPRNGYCVLALGAGISTHSVYARLIELYDAGSVSFKDVIVFNTSELFPLNPEGPSTMARLREVFLDHIDVKPENIHTVSAGATRENMYECCREYDELIDRCGGIDVCVCEVGPQGCLAFNEPAPCLRVSPVWCSSAVRCARRSLRITRPTMLPPLLSRSDCAIFCRATGCCAWHGARTIRTSQTHG